jgi:hypothetical protein
LRASSQPLREEQRCKEQRFSQNAIQEETMKSFILATAMCFAIVGGAAAQTADKQGAGNAPTKSMDAATPEMKGTGTGEHPPTQQMDKAVPEMKSGGSTTGMSTGTNMSQADCDAVWLKANPANATTITESAAQQYVTDVAAANPDKDGTLDKMEFTKACESGLVKQ